MAVKAEKDPDIKAVILKINSPGGSATASDILYREINAYKQRSGVKIVAAMMGLAASGGYYVAMPADTIVAHPTTVTGSVGAVFIKPEVSGLMEKIGVDVTVHKSGSRLLLSLAGLCGRILRTPCACRLKSLERERAT